VCKLGDFGFSKLLNTSKAYTDLGSEFYKALEIWDDNVGYSKPADIWSCGVLLYELCTLSKPFTLD